MHAGIPFPPWEEAPPGRRPSAPLCPPPPAGEPLWEETCREEADVPQEEAHIPLWEETPSQEEAPPLAEYAGRYGQRAGGTHPTGMQSC